MNARIGTALAVMAATGIGLAGAVAAPSLARETTGLRALFAADDPVTGDWDGTLSSEQMPEEIEVEISLEMDEDNYVTGGFTVMGETADFEGEWDADSATLSGVLVDPEQGQEVDCEIEIDGDEMVGALTVEAGDITIVIDLEATRRG